MSVGAEYEGSGKRFSIAGNCIPVRIVGCRLDCNLVPML